MKKTAAVVFSMLAVIVLALTALAGCAGGSDETPDSLAGTSWKVVQIKRDGVEMSEEDFLKMIGVESGEMQMIFSENQVESKIGNLSQSTADYTYENGKVKINNVADGTVEGSKMTLTDTLGITMVLQKK